MHIGNNTPRLGTAVLDEMSHAVHNGEAFSLSTEGQLSASSSIILLGMVGDKDIHFHGFSIAANLGNFTAHLYEAPTVTTNGTPIEAVNRNRNYSVVENTLLLYGGSTVSADGTVLEYSHVYDTGTQGSHLVGGTGGLSSDWVLKPNTVYMIRINNLNTEVLNYTTSFVWSEIIPTI